MALEKKDSKPQREICEGGGNDDDGSDGCTTNNPF